MYRDGRVDQALARKAEDSTLELVPGGYREGVEHVAALWAERRRANTADPSYGLTVTAQTNEDARAISEAIRERRRASGDLGEDAARAKASDEDGAEFGLALARGGRVRLLANTGTSIGGDRAVAPVTALTGISGHETAKYPYTLICQ